MSTIRVTTIQNLAGVEVYTAKAWVNFNGTGTVAIRASGNVSSITDNGTGDYTVNFTVAMTDANYSMAGLALTSNTALARFFISNTSAVSYAPATGSARIATIQSGVGNTDVEYAYISVFR